MTRVVPVLYALLVTVWVGSLWTIGYLVAPLLFAELGDRALAGRIAGWMFSMGAWVGIACAVGLLTIQVARARLAALRQGLTWVVVLMLAITLASKFGIQPLMQQIKLDAGVQDVMNSLMRDRFAAWHGVSSALYLLQSLLGLVLVATPVRVPR